MRLPYKNSVSFLLSWTGVILLIITVQQILFGGVIQNAFLQLVFLNAYFSPYVFPAPNPWSLGVWLILAVYGTYLLFKSGANYKRLKYLGPFTDALIAVALFDLIRDNIYIVFSITRWYPFSPSGNIYGLVRNTAGIVFCFVLLLRGKMGTYINVNRKTLLLYGVYALIYLIVFSVATDNSLTDWYYAVTSGASNIRIIHAFFLSHVIGKVIFALTIWSIWDPTRKIIERKERLEIREF